MVSTKEENEEKAKLICSRWQEAEDLVRGGGATERRITQISVSYTHLTLPTICSV